MTDSLSILEAMQEHHFWYRGRHRLLLAALERNLPEHARGGHAVDIGGGAGGLLRDLNRAHPQLFRTLTFTDASFCAVERASRTLPPHVHRMQLDVMQLTLDARWDCIFLLDVLEHLEDDQTALRNVARALHPGGVCFVTAPAIPAFWSLNDELVGHKRRYTRTTLAAAAQASGLAVVNVGYFMTLLAPLYLASRAITGRRTPHDPESRARHLAQTHSVPPAPINELLYRVFALETPLARHLRFPVGTSVLGIFRRP